MVEVPPCDAGVRWSASNGSSSVAGWPQMWQTAACARTAWRLRLYSALWCGLPGPAQAVHGVVGLGRPQLRHGRRRVMLRCVP